MIAKTELAPAGDGVIIHPVVPIVVDLGKQRRKRIKALKRGTGKLMDEVALALEQVRSSLGEPDQGRLLVPVVFVYKQKRKRAKGPTFPFGF